MSTLTAVVELARVPNATPKVVELARVPNAPSNVVEVARLPNNAPSGTTNAQDPSLTSHSGTGTLASSTTGFFLAGVFALCLTGCERSVETARPQEHAAPANLSNELTPPKNEPTPGIVRWVKVDDLPRDIAIMESVFWEPDDTISLRERIRTTPEMRGATVLEIGTGSGLVSLCCFQAGAGSVVATDLNPSAVANARENAKLLGFAERLEARLVPRRDPSAWTVIGPDETFDFIISNPPWENQKPVNVEQFALFDPDFRLLDSLVQGARKKLRPNGRMWLAYGCVTAIRRIQETAAKEGLECRLLDDRSLDTLPEVFLPGMLIEITVPELPK